VTGPGLLLVAGLLCAAAVTGCRQPTRTQEWNSWEYEQSAALGTLDQVETQNSYQGDPSALRPGETPDGSLPGATMSEDERRQLQATYSAQSREQAEQQRQAASEARRRQEDTLRRLGSGRSER